MEIQKRNIQKQRQIRNLDPTKQEERKSEIQMNIRGSGRNVDKCGGNKGGTKIHDIQHKQQTSHKHN